MLTFNRVGSIWNVIDPEQRLRGRRAGSYGQTGLFAGPSHHAPSGVPFGNPFADSIALTAART
jgi:hypothetical protein